MEGFSANTYKGIKGYWKRKHYQRIHRSGSRPKSRSRVDLSDLGTKRRKRFWRIKITPKLKIYGISATKKFFIRLRDAYVNWMLGVASSRGLSAGLGGGGSGGSVGYGFGKNPVKEYDEKVLVDIYKSLLLQGKLGPCRAANSASAVGVCR